ncbi:MAG TPA: heterodisulfide reductase-related iron-sulfur binding cluster [Methanobacterium sp.]|nr:heterodisulfide reductase-related iron-sulfur binding cluster [Methanobacterium sp.]
MGQAAEIMKTKDCSPLSPIYCNLKMVITGKLNQNDLKDLYDCNLCNNCYLAGLNRKTRERSVKKGIVNNHVSKIRENIIEYGNSYGIKTEKTSDKNLKMETVLFKGCTSTHKTPEILKSAERLLKIQGIKYEVMDDETCCGNILFNLGDIKAGNAAVERNIEKFKSRGIKKIITICPGCYSALNKYYASKDFNPEIILLVDLLEGLKLTGNYTIQDPCHAREKGVDVRKILSEASNRSASPCCGAGGGMMAHNKALATKKGLKTLSNDKSVVTYCPFCYLNLSPLESKRVKDLYQLLDKNLNSSSEVICAK